jgi:hypothetical protein
MWQQYRICENIEKRESNMTKQWPSSKKEISSNMKMANGNINQ